MTSSVSLFLNSKVRVAPSDRDNIGTDWPAMADPNTGSSSACHPMHWLPDAYRLTLQQFQPICSTLAALKMMFCISTNQSGKGSGLKERPEYL